MAAFRTKFYDLLIEKEQREGTRYTSITAMADEIGVSRVTFYKYTEETFTSVAANVVKGFLDFLDLSPDDLGRFLVMDLSPQFNGQDAGERKTEPVG